MTLPSPPPGWLLGLDTSAAQGHLNVPAIVAAGVSALWARATDGLHDVDAVWRTGSTQRGCQDAGLPLGVYGVLEPYALSQVTAQAAHFCDASAGVDLALPPWLDFELAHNESGLAALTSAADWCDAVEQRLGRGVMVYTGPAFIETLERYAGHAADAVLARLAARPLVVAHYTGSVDRPPIVPPPWSEWAVWQASGDHAATMPGTRVPVDVDYFRGSLDDLLALGAPSSGSAAQAA